MKKDIPELKVEDFGIAILPKEDDPDFWEVYVVNLMEDPIRSILVTATAFGDIDGEARKSATMRYFFEEMNALDIQFLEHLPTELLAITNEYWVSFSYNDQLWDKQFLVTPGSLEPVNYIPIPFLNRKGILKR